MDALADDLLYGAAAIAEYLFGDRKKRRRVYHLNATGHCRSAEWVTSWSVANNIDKTRR